MRIRVEHIRIEPVVPSVGQDFYIYVSINAPSERDIALGVEKQRILPAIGGNPLLFPTGEAYFEKSPSAILIKAGDKTGLSLPIAVSVNAHAPGGDPPVIFPEKLLFTIFEGAFSEGFRNGACIVASIADMESQS